MILYSSCQKNILLLGGNGLLGSAAVEALLKANTDNQYNITKLNRGNWYWDTEVTVKPFVHHIQCERGDEFQDDCLVKDNGVYYEAIIDFSCYHPLDMEDILIALKGRFKYYIYISSDSVYEVCESHNEIFSKEHHAVRPSDEKIRDKLASKDSYGNNKLKGEETLEKFHIHLDFNYISLRLADVIGARDNTHRFWKYYLWCKLNNITGPIHIPPHLIDRKLSFVYSRDVADTIVDLLLIFDKESIWNSAYNLAFESSLTLKEFLTKIGLLLKQEINFDETEEAHINFGFPSVSRGPISCDKGKQKLMWNPTDIDVALKEICKFYESAQYKTDNKFILDHILDSLDIRRDKYRDFLEMHHASLPPISKDEL